MPGRWYKTVVPMYVWFTGVTQHGWLLFGLEADPDVRGRKTGRRKDGKEGGCGEEVDGSRQWEEGE